MSTVAVLGASGMLGHKLCQVLNSMDHQVFGIFRAASPFLCEVLPQDRLIAGVDVLDDAQLGSAIARCNPQFVVNAVGVVKQLKEASNKHISTAINAWLPHRLANLCKGIDARLIHISTDCVFDGVKGSYAEEDESNARDIYGKSKWLGEIDSESVAITIRTSIIGRELRRPTHGLVEWFLSQRDKIIKGYAKAIFSGLTTLELSRVIAMVIEKHPNLAGLHHVSTAPIDKFALLQLCKDAYNVPITIQRDESFHCDRSLVMKKFSDTTGYRAPAWERLIREMAEDPTPYDRVLADS